MEFLRDMQKEEIFIRYVHQLAQLQADARNPTEAGLALRLHADLYDWDPTKIVPPLADPPFPAQSQFDRKERIYFDIIKHFEDGEAWSSALGAYQELQQQYQDNVYDFPKLARTQRAIATIYETIAKSDKLVPKYFRVMYRGMGFPPSLRDKEFVFEGSPTERTSAFTDRMQEQHPSAHIVTTGDVEDVEGQFLQISALSPHRDLEHHVFQRARISQVVKDYLLSTHPQIFSVTSKRNTSGPVQEHSAEKIIYTTAESFPTILRRSEIVAIDKLKLNATQTALERIIRKTQEMCVVEKRLIEGEEEMAPLLIDAINISVNPNSDSTIAKYRDLLPVNVDGEEIEEVELNSLENALKVALIDHAVMIKRCLGIFAKPEYRAHIEAVPGTRDELAQCIYPFSSLSSPPISSYYHSQFRSGSPIPRKPRNKHSVAIQVHPSLQSNINAAHTDFESTFAPELASFTFPPTQTLSPSPNNSLPSWQIASPVLSDRSMRNSRIGMTNSNTNGTIRTQDTSILDTPSGGRVRRSFFGSVRRDREGGRSTHEAVLAPVINGGGKKEKDGRGRGDSSASKDDSQLEGAKENRRSFFSANGGGLGRGRTREEEWVTQSDLSAASTSGVTGFGVGGGGGSGVNRRSSSSQRPTTAKSSAAGTVTGTGSGTASSVGSRVGSVRKRLSMLKLGKKTSKASVLVGSVTEEE
jgi:hypothetical protein